MHLNKGSSNQAKHAFSNHIFGKIVWKQLVKAIVVFVLAYITLIVGYEQTALKRIFTDAVLETIGKMGAKWISKSHTAFYYINSPDEGRYDEVKLNVVPSGTTTADLREGRVQLKVIPFKLYTLCYYPVAFGLALAFAMPLKFSKKIWLLILSSIGLTVLIWAKFMVFLMEKVPYANGGVSGVKLLNQILNAHSGMSKMLIFMLIAGTAAWLGRAAESRKKKKSD